MAYAWSQHRLIRYVLRGKHTRRSTTSAAAAAVDAHGRTAAQHAKERQNRTQNRRIAASQSCTGSTSNTY